jgi:hypothetical protein
VLIVAELGGASSQADDPCKVPPRFAGVDAAGRESTLVVGDDDLVGAREWQPGKGEPPVTVGQAIALATSEASAAWPALEQVEVKHIRLVSGGCHKHHAARWLYLVTFDAYRAGRLISVGEYFLAVGMNSRVFRPSVAARHPDDEPRERNSAATQATLSGVDTDLRRIIEDEERARVEAGCSTSGFYTTRDATNRGMRLVASDRAISKPPAWAPGMGEPPVSVGSAVEFASRWIDGQVSGGRESVLESVRLQPVGCGYNRNAWVYVVTFASPDALTGRMIPVGVLIDGTVIAPQDETGSAAR